MTAVPYDDVRAAPRVSKPPIAGGDPVADAVGRLLSIPLREVYAALWRLGLIEVR